MHTFAISDRDFLLDGAPFRVFAGAIHYFRVPRAYWRDRLIKLKACGFNTVETYVAWNAHMPAPDCFQFDDMLDLSEFLRLSQELGLWAIVRPGPYICSEWEFGGLPWWLLKEDIPLRCADPRYLAHVDDFFARLIPRLRNNLLTHGGNILMMQVENEYGSYGDDQAYLTHVRDTLLRLGVDVPLFTSDGATDFMLTGGTIPGIHKTANFGSRAREQFAKLREHQPDGPLMCTEYWNGWFDHWSEAHHSRTPQEAVDGLKEILDCGASFSAYMFHGGTNFGFMNGANCPEARQYQPTVNSYDDDAPLNECGDITPKYRLMRELMKRYTQLPDIALPAPVPKKRYGEVKLTRACTLWAAIDALAAPPVRAATPLPMEKIDQGYGFTLYSCALRGPREDHTLRLHDVHDRAHVFMNRRLAGIVYRNDPASSVDVAVPREGVKLDILVENMGRVNYGLYLRDPKGITRGVSLGQQYVYGWDMRALPLSDVSALPLQQGVPAFDGTPLFLSGEFDAGEAPADTFVKLPGFSKGVIFINGRPLSRHWSIGPQRSAYLPAPFLKPGRNTLTILELDGFESPAAFLDDNMDLG